MWEGGRFCCSEKVWSQAGEVDGSTYLQGVLHLSSELDPAEGGEVGVWLRVLPIKRD